MSFLGRVGGARWISATTTLWVMLPRGVWYCWGQGQKGWLDHMSVTYKMILSIIRISSSVIHLRFKKMCDWRCSRGTDFR